METENNLPAAVAGQQPCEDPQWLRGLKDSARLNYEAGVSNEREQCAEIADQFERDEIDYAARKCAANIATEIRKDRGSDPPQAEPYSNRELLEFLDQLYFLEGHGGAYSQSQWWAGHEGLIETAKATRRINADR